MPKQKWCSIWLPLEEMWSEWLGENCADPSSTPARGDVRVETHAAAVDVACEVLEEIPGSVHRALIFSTPELAREAGGSKLDTQQGRARAAAKLSDPQHLDVLGITMRPSAVGFALIQNERKKENDDLMWSLTQIEVRGRVHLYRAKRTN